MDGIDGDTGLDRYLCYDVSYICEEQGRKLLQVSAVFMIVNFVITMTGLILSCVIVCGDTFMMDGPTAGRKSGDATRVFSAGMLYSTPGFVAGRLGYPPLVNRNYHSLPKSISPELAGRFDERVDRYREAPPRLVPGEVRPQYEQPGEDVHQRDDDRARQESADIDESGDTKGAELELNPLVMRR